MRVAVVYDCLYPYTIGGGERWYRALQAEDRAATITEWTREATAGRPFAKEFRLARNDGDTRWVLMQSAPIRAEQNDLTGHVVTFEDITERAGVGGGPGWTSGVTMADVNGDGFLDIYVSGVNHLSISGRNVLYINNGDATFTDRAEEYGLAFAGYSTQAAFFDYDGDADLDMYLLNSSTHAERLASPSTSRTVRNAKAGDRLYRNDNGRFVDVSATAGIYGGVEGFGLGVVASDVNLDGCLDIYVANDTTDNLLYLNKSKPGQLRFEEVGLEWGVARDHNGTSNGSMGVDLCDYDLDGWPDLWTVNFENEAIALYRNLAKGQFTHVSRAVGLRALGGLYSSFGTGFADLDCDGDEDVVVINGHVRLFPQLSRREQLPLLLINDRASDQFRQAIFPADHYFSTSHLGRGLALGDLDDDGDLDEGEPGVGRLVLGPVGHDEERCPERVPAAPGLGGLVGGGAGEALGGAHGEAERLEAAVALVGQVARADHPSDRPGDQGARKLFRVDRDRAAVRRHDPQVEPRARRARDFAPVTEDRDGRNRADAERARELGILVRIDLHELHAAGVRGGELFQHRRQRAARAAPRRPEIDQHQLLARTFDDFLLEIGGRNVHGGINGNGGAGNAIIQANSEPIAGKSTTTHDLRRHRSVHQVQVHGLRRSVSGGLLLRGREHAGHQAGGVYRLRGLRTGVPGRSDQARHRAGAGKVAPDQH